MSVEQILSQYVKFEKRGRELVLLCPFHKERTPSCFISTKTGQFYCFGCKKGGSLKKFLSLFGGEKIDYSFLESSKEEIKEEKEEVILDESILKYFQYLPEDLVKKGFNPELLWNYRIGFHLERKRNIFPIRNMKGQLLGVSGGSIIGAEPKYKVYRGCFYSGGKKYPSDFGDWFDDIYPDYGIFDKSSYVWNLDKVCRGDYEFIIIVEGFKAALMLIQNGFPNVIALMGSNFTEEQKNLLLRLKTKYYIMLDNDGAGEIGKNIIKEKLYKFSPLYMVEYQSKQPDDLSKIELEQSIKQAKEIKALRGKTNENDSN